MLIPRLCLLSLLLGVAASSASAVGIGSGSPAAVMGQPLDFAVQVRLEPGAGLEPQCVEAEVTVGERRVPAYQVGTAVEMIGVDLARVRVRTQQPIDEPVLGIDLRLGCQARLARRFVVLADPPLHMPSAAPPLAALIQEPPASAPVALTAPEAAAAPEPAAAPAAARKAAGAPMAKSTERRTARAPQPRADRRSSSARKATVLVKGRPPAQPARLRLDMLEPAADPQTKAIEEALSAVAEAASAARAAASAASASAQRIAALEQTVTQLRQENKAGADLVLQLRERLAQVDGTNIWILPLLLLAGALATLAAWLAWRLSLLQRSQQEAWRSATPARAESSPGEASQNRPPTSPAPFVTAGQTPASPAAAKARSVPAWPPAAAVSPLPEWATTAGPTTEPGARDPITTQVLPAQRLDALTQNASPAGTGGRPDPGAASSLERTDILPPRAPAEPGAPRDVSIEELIDLEQQAEFFVVLGQDEAAVDLLVEHLRTTGGGSPLPYLKLLEIHHRMGDRAAYERARTRFNHRFNAFAPEWGADLHGGRSLEDYAGVVPRLQQVWARPLDAMAELEALLFRKSRGELFELPAYREVLFLYSLARDLMDREAADSGSVDLLLPLSEGEFGSTTPAPYLGLAGQPPEDPPPDFDSRPTAPVDFDISAAEPGNSIFGTLDEPPPPTRPGPR